MKLCRTVTLTKERKISHAVYPMAKFESCDQILAEPVKLSFDSFRLAALAEDRAILSPDFHFVDDIRIVWSILIADHVDKKPLFSNTSSSQALLLAGEIISNLFEGFQSFGHRLESVTPNRVTQHLALSYVIEKGNSSWAALGAALCFSTMLDGLLFVRGLALSSSTLHIDDEIKIGRVEFINLYRFILTEIYGH